MTACFCLVLVWFLFWRPASKGYSYRAYAEGEKDMKHLMKQFLMALSCVIVGLLTGVLLSNAIISPLLSNTDIIEPKNGLIVQTYR
jgi:hypothetical protein